MADTVIPLVDLQRFNTSAAEDDVQDDVLQELAAQVIDAFTTVGIVRLTNHGVDQSQIDEAMRQCTTFFELPTDAKERYRQQGTRDNHGWLAMDRERVDPGGNADIKEVYDVALQHAKVWPDSDVPEFKPAMINLYNQCSLLADRLLQLIAIGLKLKERYIFRKNHNTGKKANSTILRSLFYPPIKDTAGLSRDQLRLGEHTDYGAITLLFQDEAGGLELCTGEDTYVAAPPIAGTVLVNIGDLMQRWTGDKLRSTKHRVVIPPECARRGRARMSIVYFDHPDDDCVIECLDGSNKYAPVTAVDYFVSRLEATYFD